MSKEEVLKYIDDINDPGFDLPFKNIIDKFNNDPDVMTKLLVKYDGNEYLNQNYCDMLLNTLIDNNDDVIIPEGANIRYLACLLPFEKAQDGDNQAVTMDDNQKKVFKALVEKANDFENLARLVYKASQTSELRQEVENRIMFLLEPPTADNLNKAIGSFYLVPRTLARKMINLLNITEISEGISKCKAKVFESALKNNQNCSELFNNAINKGWLSSETLKSGEETDNTWYSYGDKDWVASYKDNKVVTKQKAEILNELATQDGKNKANEIYSLVLGANTGDETKTLRDNLKDPNYITKDNVVALLEIWYNTDIQGIIEYLNREWNGPTIAEMEVIPKALIELAEANGLSSEEYPLKSLIEFVEGQHLQNKETTDYPNNSYAKRIDELMKEVLDKLS